MIETPQFTHTSSQLTALIPLTVPRADIQMMMGPGAIEAMEAARAQGIGPTGPWFTHHLKIDPEVFDFEICIPVSDPVTATGRVLAGEWPPMKVVRTVYHGPYEGLGKAWGEFEAWIESQGLKVMGDLWERYLVGPESGPDESGYRTELNKQLVD